ncbi:MAG: PilX N-terminal domain-containing pilus assembly protein [Planctomycetota bacterium]
MTRPPQPTAHRESGAALILALLVLVVLGTVTTLSIERAGLLARSDVHQRERLRALFAAEGGVAQARHALALDPDYSGARLRIDTCDVEIEVTSRATDPRQWTVRSVGRHPGAKGLTYSIETVLRDGPGLPAVVSWLER